MSRWIPVDPSDSVPIWKQIEEGIRRLVGSGGLRPGDPIPSVRELARDLQINPNTVFKAYQRLTDRGVLMIRRGEGTFVNTSAPSLDETERRRQLREAANRYAALAATLSAGPQEIQQELKAVLEEMGLSKRGGKS